MKTEHHEKSDVFGFALQRKMQSGQEYPGLIPAILHIGVQRYLC